MDEHHPTPRLYADLSEWWPLMSPPEEYEEEAAFYRRVLQLNGEPPLRTLLELGSGGGHNAFHMKQGLQVTLVDLSPGMLAHSRRLNPDCEHLTGDMRSVRLDRQFDAVFVQDAICYMTTEADLESAIRTAFAHCRPGGVALLAPDHVRENYQPSTDCGGADGEDRGIRYLEWSYDPDPSDQLYTVDYAYLLREPDGTTRVEHDRHLEGLFPRSTWQRILTEAGFLPTVIPFEHSDYPGELEVFRCVRPD